MKAKFFLIAPLLFSVLLVGCIGAGTHGSIKGYEYATSKYTLQEAVLKVIASNANIQRDTAHDYYNDGDDYLTIQITKGALVNNYTFKFGGGKE